MWNQQPKRFAVRKQQPEVLLCGISSLRCLLSGDSIQRNLVKRPGSLEMAAVRQALRLLPRGTRRSLTSSSLGREGGQGGHEGAGSSEGGGGSWQGAKWRAGALGAAVLGHSLLQGREERVTALPLVRERRGFPSLLPAVRAAEPLGSEGGEGVKAGEGGGGKAPSRRAAFNFIADVVVETAPSLVYIEIKVDCFCNLNLHTF